MNNKNNTDSFYTETTDEVFAVPMKKNNNNQSGGWFFNKSESASLIACRNNNMVLLDELLKEKIGGPYDWVDKNLEWNILHYISHYGNKLKNNGCDALECVLNSNTCPCIEKKDKNNDTPLAIAAKMKNNKLCYLYIHRGANREIGKNMSVVTDNSESDDVSTTATTNIIDLTDGNDEITNVSVVTDVVLMSPKNNKKTSIFNQKNNRSTVRENPIAIIDNLVGTTDDNIQGYDALKGIVVITDTNSKNNNGYLTSSMPYIPNVLYSPTSQFSSSQMNKIAKESDSNSQNRQKNKSNTNDTLKKQTTLTDTNPMSVGDSATSSLVGSQLMIKTPESSEMTSKNDEELSGGYSATSSIFTSHSSLKSKKVYDTDSYIHTMRQIHDSLIKDIKSMNGGNNSLNTRKINNNSDFYDMYTEDKFGGRNRTKPSQVDLLHEETIKKIKELTNETDENAKLYKAALYKKTKEDNPNLSGIERAKKMRDSVSKSVLKKIDIAKIAKEIEEAKLMKTNKEQVKKGGNDVYSFYDDDSTLGFYDTQYF